MFHKRLLLSLAMLLLPIVADADDDKVHEGQWEITHQITLPGMPFQPPPHTQTQCITRKDRVPKPHQQQGKCDISLTKAEGNKVQWHIKCSGERQAEGDGEVAYGGDTMEGHATLKMKNPRTGQPMEAQQTITGRRIGDCPK
jgi:hypothetical protein